MCFSQNIYLYFGILVRCFTYGTVVVVVVVVVVGTVVAGVALVVVVLARA
jgi:hypothetical protein